MNNINPALNTQETVVSGKYKNIEFIFLSILGFAILIFLVMIIGIIIQTTQFLKENPEFPVGAEWAGLAVFLFMCLTAYTSVFFIWQLWLWRKFLANQKRKYWQLGLIAIFCILPVTFILGALVVTAMR